MEPKVDSERKPFSLGYVRTYKDLDVYRRARKLAFKVFQASRRFPREETYSLTDQVRRSSRAIGAQIAEAWAKRNYERHFVSKLTDADAENLETQHWIEVAYDCGYLSPEDRGLFLSDLIAIGSMIGGMIRKAPVFCSPRPNAVCEELAEYFVKPESD